MTDIFLFIIVVFVFLDWYKNSELKIRIEHYIRKRKAPKSVKSVSRSFKDAI